MKAKAIVLGTFVMTLSFLIFLFGPTALYGHCDTLDGPVIKAAQRALDTSDVNLILIWVQKKDEAEIKKAFQKTLVVRQLSPQAKELVDMYFFETLVRIHRAGEGAPYTGLKPAGLDLGTAVPAADKALDTGKLEPLYRLLMKTVEEDLHKSFERAMSLKNYKKDNVEAGREYIEAYVPFVHYVERLYEAAKYPTKGHYPEPEETGGHKH